MIARLRGEVAEIAADRIVLDVGGVGYDLLVPARTAEAARPGAALTLHVRTNVREDAITLFGFASLAEKECFDLLVSVNQVGPRIALSALSTFPVDALSRAVNANDLRALSSIPGVGKKTAERIVLELRGKLAFSPTEAPTARVADDPLPLALAQLGYKKSEIDTALARIAERGLSAAPVEARIAESLRILSGGPPSGGAPRGGGR